jgi:hypothetical protein
MVFTVDFILRRFLKNRKTILFCLLLTCGPEAGAACMWASISSGIHCRWHHPLFVISGWQHETWFVCIPAEAIKCFNTMGLQVRPLRRGFVLSPDLAGSVVAFNVSRASNVVNMKAQMQIIANTIGCFAFDELDVRNLVGSPSVVRLLGVGALVGLGFYENLQRRGGLAIVDPVRPWQSYGRGGLAIVHPARPW